MEQVSDSRERHTLTFEDDMWDQLNKMSAYQRHGSNLLSGLQNFAVRYNQVVSKFADGLRQCSSAFEKEMFAPLKEKGEHSNMEFTTLSIAVSSIKSGVDSLASVLDEATQTVVGDLVEPLETYQKQYNIDCVESLQKGGSFWAEYQDALSKQLDAKERFVFLKQQAEQQEVCIEEAMLAHERGLIPVEKVQRINKKGVTVKYRAEVATQTYKQSLENLNARIASFDTDYKPQLQKLQQLEEARINFTKYSLEKLMKHLNTLGSKISASAQTLGDQSQFISSETDIKLFINENRSENEVPAQQQFEDFSSSEDLNKYKSALAARQHLEAEQNAKFEDEESKDPAQRLRPEERVRRLFYSCVIESTPWNATEQEYITKSVSVPEVRQQISDFLKAFSAPRSVKDQTCLKQLGEVLMLLLDVFEKQRDQACLRELHSVMHSAQLLFAFNTMESKQSKIFLTNFIDSHKIWADVDIWKSCLQRIINLKFHDAVKQIEANNQEKKEKEQEKGAQSAGGFLSSAISTGLGGFGKLKGSLFGKDSHLDEEQKEGAKSRKSSNSQQSTDTSSSRERPNSAAKKPVKKKPQTLRISKTLAQNIIFNTTSMFIGYFVNFKLDFDTSRELLMHFCKKYELDQSRTHLLLSELESVQKNAKYAITWKDLRQISEQNKSRRLSKFSSNPKYFSLGQSIKYFQNDQDLVKLLMLNKETNQLFRSEVYKQALVVSQPERLPQKRVKIWSNILQLDQTDIDYNMFKSKVLANKKLIQNVEEVIVLDVQRSAHNMSGVDPQVLTNVLMTYAYYNPEIEYCQGMNFIGGFLLMVFKDEELAFKALRQLVERFNMADLFNSDLPKLKLFFYQMDRLISIVEPDLHSHFKEEMINSSYFASAWFITIFTNSVKSKVVSQQQDMKEQNIVFENGELVSENLLQLWDYFLVSGWKAILKMGLYVLRSSNQQLVQMSFEDILNEITELPKQLLCTEGVKIQVVGNDTQIQQENHLNITTVYETLKLSFQDENGSSLLSFHLERLNAEFEESHAAAKLQPKENKQITLQHRPQVVKQ